MFGRVSVLEVTFRDEAEVQLYELFSPELDISSGVIKLPASGLDIDLRLDEDWEIAVSKRI